MTRNDWKIIRKKEFSCWLSLGYFWVLLDTLFLQELPAFWYSKSNLENFWDGSLLDIPSFSTYHTRKFLGKLLHGCAFDIIVGLLCPWIWRFFPHFHYRFQLQFWALKYFFTRFHTLIQLWNEGTSLRHHATFFKLLTKVKRMRESVQVTWKLWPN